MNETITSDEARQVLGEAGLTDYESRAYLSLLKRGVMTARKISEYGNIPYSKVYETLNSLEKKGWVEVKRERPTRYYAKSPSEAIEAARLRLEEMVGEWKRIASSQLQPLYERRELREKPDIWILRGESSTLAKLQEMLSMVKKELMVAAPDFAMKFMDVSVPTLAHLRNVGIKVSVMVTKKWDVETMSNIGEVRARDNLFGGGVIVDAREALLILGDDKPSLVIWSNHIGLVKFARDYFQYLWESVRPESQ